MAANPDAMKDVFMIGRKLRHLREDRKYTQEYVALELGVKATSTYSDYEREVISVPQEVVVKAAELYKVDLGYFYSRGPVQITMNDQASNGYVEQQHVESKELIDRFFAHIAERDKRIEDLLAKAIERLSGGA